MISKSVNNIGYEGMAVIKLPSSYQKFKIKNSGTVNLGNLFTNALINNIDKKDCPSFFDLQYKTTFEIPWKSLLYNIVLGPIHTLPTLRFHGAKIVADE